MNIYCIKPKGYNIGNDIIFLSMRHFIQKAFGFIPNLIVLPATSKYEKNDRAGLTSKTIHEINQFGSGVIVGGGNLYENNELDLNINALDKLEVPLFLFSLSRGQIYNKDGYLTDRTDVMPNEKIIALQKKALISCVRDQTTQDYIQDQLNCNCILSACPTLFFDKSMNEVPSVSNKALHPITISIRNPDLMSIPVDKKNKAIELIKFIIETEKDVQILCQDYRDIPFAASLGINYFYTESIFTFLSILKQSRRVISFRLHSTLPCLCMNTPVVNISYDERSLSLLQTIGASHLNINLIHDGDVRKKINNLREPVDKLQWTQFYNTILESFQLFSGRL